MYENTIFVLKEETILQAKEERFDVFKDLRNKLKGPVENIREHLRKEKRKVKENQLEHLHGIPFTFHNMIQLEPLTPLSDDLCHDKCKILKECVSEDGETEPLDAGFDDDVMSVETIYVRGVYRPFDSVLERKRFAPSASDLLP